MQRKAMEVNRKWRLDGCNERETCYFNVETHALYTGLNVYEHSKLI